MATLAEMQSQLENLKSVRANGMAGYEIEGQSVTYRRDAELSAAISDLESRIAAVQGQAVRNVRFTTSKGL